jgi:chemotaxis signal transduction protein
MSARDDSSSSSSARVAELRRAFDLGFAAPPKTEREELENLLAIHVAGERFALRVSELAGLQPQQRIVPLPGARAGLLGLAGVRGRLVPVYSLASLLGYAAQDQQQETRWLAVCGSEQPVALAFAQFDGHRQPPRSDLLKLPANEARDDRREVVRLDGVAVPLVHLPSLLAKIHASLSASSSSSAN